MPFPQPRGDPNIGCPFFLPLPICDDRPTAPVFDSGCLLSGLASSPFSFSSCISRVEFGHLFSVPSSACFISLMSATFSPPVVFHGKADWVQLTGCRVFKLPFVHVKDPGGRRSLVQSSPFFCHYSHRVDVCSRYSRPGRFFDSFSRSHVQFWLR